MANTLLIEKETGGYYGFTLTIDGVVQDKIRNMFNDAFGKNNLVTINNSTGANLVKKQNISVFDITLIASGTFTFSDIDDFLVKLIDIGFFDWRLGTGGGSGATRFDDLLDTFQYFGQDGKGVRVNESEQKLETYDVYNYRTITDLEDTYDVGIPNKMLVTDNDGNVALEDKITIPQPYLNSIGSFHYADLATQTTPFTVIANVPKKLTNDGAGDGTNISNAPYGVPIMLSNTGSLYFGDLSIGDLVTFRLDAKFTTTGANQTYSYYIVFGVGSGSEFTRYMTDSHKKTTGILNESGVLSFDIENQLMKDYYADVYIVSDRDGTIVINDFYFEVIRKNINVIDIDGLTDLSATRTPTNVSIESSTGTPAVIGLGNGTNAGFSLNDYTSAEKSKLSGISTGANVGVVPNTAITGATKTKITYDSKGLVTAGTDLIESDIPTLGQAKITNLTTDLALKAPLSSPTFTGTPLAPTATAGTNNTQVATTAFVSTATTNAVSGKMNTPSGTANFLSKFLTASTIGISRIFDNGTFIGIGTVNTPTKDITLSNSSDKEIGVENSESTTIGKNFKVNAGSTVNYILNPNVTAISSTIYGGWGNATDINGDVFFNDFSVGVKKIVHGTNNITVVSTPASIIYSQEIAIGYDNSIYQIFQGTNVLYRNAVILAGASGYAVSGIFASKLSNKLYASFNGNINFSTNNGVSFTSIQSGSITAGKICEDSFGNIYTLINGYLWKQTGGTGTFSNTNTIMLGDYLACDSNNKIYSATTTTLYSLAYNSTVYVVEKNLTGMSFLTGIAIDLDNRIIFTRGTNQGSIQYQLSTAVLGTPDLNGGILKLEAGTGKGAGQSRIEFNTGQKTASGTAMQSLTTRGYIDENGYFVYIMNTYADNAAAVSAGLPVNSFYKDSSGNLKIVF
ncbi:hypothetical protein [Flavobacterium sp.]|uniref:hypothetical protein n=1 Tax=Flavobacterium sp. TaxID=239 RepID=UPI0038FC2DAD